MTRALIARADEGGIGTQTWEIARHVPFDRLLVMEVEPHRGTFRPDRFDGLVPEVRLTGPRHRNQLSADDVHWLCETDRVFFVEDCYSDPRYSDVTLEDVAPRTGTRLTVQANPELFSDRHRSLVGRGVLDVFAPTEWERGRLGEHRLVRMPVALDWFHPHFDRNPRRLLHVSAPAFLDRNGTALLRAALRNYRGPHVEVAVSGPERPGVGPRWDVHPRRVTVEPLDDVEDYWERYTPDYGALVQPRRYGGLSLVAQEAAAAGMPVICLDREPESGWGGTVRVPVASTEDYRMKGGRFPVANCDPRALGTAIADYAESDPFDLAYSAAVYALTISWGKLRQEWLDALGEQEVRT